MFICHLCILFSEMSVHVFCLLWFDCLGFLLLSFQSSLCILLGWPNSSGFFCKMVLVRLVVFNFIWNNFVRLYCDTCHIRVHFLKKLKLVNFCVATLILKMEEKKQHFWHIMPYYFQKSKNTTEMQKRFVQCIEKVLWLIEHDKSGLQSFVLEISHWMMLHSQVDQLKW